jgi:hypothetical protein
MSFPMGFENLDFCSQVNGIAGMLIYTHARSIETDLAGALERWLENEARKLRRKDLGQVKPWDVTDLDAVKYKFGWLTSAFMLHKAYG